MKSVVAVFALWIVLGSAPAMAADSTPAPVIVDDLIAAPKADEPRPATRLHVLDRRRLGLTTKNIIRILQEMKANGDLAKYVSDGEDGIQGIDVSNLSVEIASRLASERPDEWSDIDWDNVLSWLERVLELLIKYLPIVIDLFA